MRKLKPLPGYILVAGIDLDKVSGVSEDGTAWAGELDPETGLVMAEGILPPAGVIIGVGDDCPDGLQLKRRVVLQRIRGNQHRESILWQYHPDEEPIRCQRIRAAEPCCGCGELVATDDVIAVEGSGGVYHAVGARVLVRPLPVDNPSDILDVTGGTRELVSWGTVVSVGPDALDADIGHVVAWGQFTGARWTASGRTWVSLRAPRRACCQVRRGELHLVQR